jgi:hypothetical protein
LTVDIYGTKFSTKINLNKIDTLCYKKRYQGKNGDLVSQLLLYLKYLPRFVRSSLVAASNAFTADTVDSVISCAHVKTELKLFVRHTTPWSFFRAFYRGI